MSKALDTDKALAELRSKVKQIDAAYAQLDKRAAYAEEHECDPGWSYARFDEKNADDREVIAELAGPIVNLFTRLDEALSNGGDIPEAWKETRA